MISWWQVSIVRLKILPKITNGAWYDQKNNKYGPILAISQVFLWNGYYFSVKSTWLSDKTPRPIFPNSPSGAALQPFCHNWPPGGTSRPSYTNWPPEGTFGLTCPNWQPGVSSRSICPSYYGCCDQNSHLSFCLPEDMLTLRLLCRRR